MTSKIYLITPETFEIDDFCNKLNIALEEDNISCLQLRLKNKNDYFLNKAIEKISPICKNKDIIFMINDRYDLVNKFDIDGVHIGVDDGNVKNVRKIIGPDKFIGASCYDSKDLAFTAGEDGADYVSFGAFFDSKTKKSRGKPSIELLEWWTSYTTLPVVAIGGITPENCKELVKAKADHLAIISYIWHNDKLSPKEAIAEMNKKIREACEVV